MESTPNPQAPAITPHRGKRGEPVTWKLDVFRMVAIAPPGYPTPYCATARRPGRFMNTEGRTPAEALERLKRKIAEEGEL